MSMSLPAEFHVRLLSSSVLFIGTESYIYWRTCVVAVLDQDTKGCEGSHCHCKGVDVMWTSGPEDEARTVRSMSLV